MMLELNVYGVSNKIKATSKNCFSSDLWNTDFVDVAIARNS